MARGDSRSGNSPSWFLSMDSVDASHQDAHAQSFARLWNAFMRARVFVATVLLALQGAMLVMGSSRVWLLGWCTAYLVLTLAALRWSPRAPARSEADWRWVWTLGADVAVFATLQFFQYGGLHYTPLFVLPVLLAAILGPLRLALATAAAVTLFLLGEAWWLAVGSYVDPTARYLQSGLTGTGFFLVALLAHQLALRLAREEAVAQSSQLAARAQAQVNALIIEGLSEGILVLDAQGRARHANPAAQTMLQDDSLDANTGGQSGMASGAAWMQLVDLVKQTFVRAAPLEAELRLDLGRGVTRKLYARTHLSSPQGATQEGLCVVFLEDMREVEARVRTEKLAAMGRMSAAVAHEIRNPLAAISQANALLEEEVELPAHKRLIAMIGQNVQRLSRIVDDVLNVARLEPPGDTPAPHLPLDLTVHQIVHDWMQPHRCDQVLEVRTHCPQTTIGFDPEHLRRLLVNLLDNALRYASGAPASICVLTRPEGLHRVRMSVWSDGRPLESSVRRHLFEPFFSSESRSSGLGLYISRELCERYGAQIGYRRVPLDDRDGNEFYVLMPRLPTLPRALNSLQTQAQ